MEALASSIAEFLSKLFGNNVVLATIIAAMIPILELKGAIPFAMNEKFWELNALNGVEAFFSSMFGCLIVTIVVSLTFKPILKLLKSTKLFKKIAVSFENRANEKKKKISKEVTMVEITEKDKKKKARKKWLIKFFGVMLFVADPLPFTGVWTGTCIAVLIGLNFWSTIASVTIGNAIAGIFVTLLAGWNAEITFYIMMCVLILILLSFFVKYVVRKVKESKIKKVAD